MTLLAFQQALCDLIASPELCQSVRTDPEYILSLYELDTREHHRLINVVHQRGMSTSCTLYRVNRITPIYTQLPHTCFLLDDDLLPEVELFWKGYVDTDMQFRSEISHFGDHLKQRINSGAIDNSLLEEVLDFELATNELKYLPRHQITNSLQNTGFHHTVLGLQLHPLIRLVRFRHDPSMLLNCLSQLLPPPYELLEGNFFTVLDASKDDLEVKRIDSRLGMILQIIRDGEDPDLTREEVRLLLDSGLVIYSERVIL